MVLLAIVTGILAGINYWWQSDVSSTPLRVVGFLAQLVLAGLTVLAVVAYRGPRDEPAPFSLGWTRWWTFRFGIIIFSLLGNVCIMVALTLRLLGVIDHL